MQGEKSVLSPIEKVTVLTRERVVQQPRNYWNYCAQIDNELLDSPIWNGRYTRNRTVIYLPDNWSWKDNIWYCNFNKKILIMSKMILSI